ncbi:MAG TPA: VOC family protein [Rhodanobacteraceae bacterium]|nr:VOC family protein [Rhodanobacteraceae bacterium]
MQITPYLLFDGRCKEAFDFYAKALGGRITATMTYGESPMARDMPADSHHRILHTHLESDGAVLMGSDGPHSEVPGSPGISVTVTVDDPAEAERIFAALSAGSEVRMAIEETFWAHRFGMLTDRYGKPWMVNCAKPREG